MLTTVSPSIARLDEFDAQVMPMRGVDAAVLRLVGDYDIATVTSLTACLAKVVAADERDVVLDLSDVTFVDASTVTVLVLLEQHLHLDGRLLHLQSLSPCAARLVSLCHLERLLEPN